jgi:hypothetical protein
MNLISFSMNCNYFLLQGPANCQSEVNSKLQTVAVITCWLEEAIMLLSDKCWMKISRWKMTKKKVLSHCHFVHYKPHCPGSEPTITYMMGRWHLTYTLWQDLSKSKRLQTFISAVTFIKSITETRQPYLKIMVAVSSCPTHQCLLSWIPWEVNKCNIST